MLRKSTLLLSLLSLGTLCHGMEKVSLQLKWLHQFQFAGYYAAIEQGYYQAEGLEVELIEATHSEDPSDSVLDGRADFGVSNAEVLVLRAQGEPVVALAAIYQHSPLVFTSIRSSGIESIHDLAGKRIMIEPNSADLFALLKAEQIPMDTIEFVPHSFSTDPLQLGEVDALSSYITDEPFAIRSLGEEPIVFSPRSTGIDFYGDILFTTEATIEAKPEMVAAFRRASLRGWSYALDNPEAVIDLILEKYPTQKSPEALRYEAKRTIDLIRADIVEIGYMNPGRWQHIAEVFRSVGMIETPPDLNQFIYRSERPLSETIPFKTICISLVCISLLALVAGIQWRHRRRLENEIQKRKVSDDLLNEREGEYRTMVEGAPVAFIVWDAELNISQWNQEAEKLFGWSSSEAIGNNAIDLIVPPSANETVRTGISTLKKDAPLTQINENKTKDGQILWCRWHNVPRKNAQGIVTEFHSIAIDVSDEVHNTERLEKDRQSALSANEAKDQLLASTSHEIRNPLNAIMGFTQLIIDDAQSSETKEMAKVVLDGAEDMLAILNDLLDTARIESGKMPIDRSTVQLDDCIQKEAKLFSQLIKEQGLDFKVSIPSEVPTIISDLRWIRQILHNLINNARKFTDQGQIKISLKVNTPKTVAIVVADTGIGMNDATLANVFEPFTQGPTKTTHSATGSGLGLSLTKKLAELIGGTLRAESKLGEGSTFTLELPIEAS
ncbi:MAG: ABC transporter substrate-binding protein [Opitutaceae bacterium]